MGPGPDDEPDTGLGSVLGVRNSRVKTARRFHRRAVRMQERMFLVEGPKALAEALDVPGCLVEVFVAPEAATVHATLLTAVEEAGAVVRRVDDAALASLADTVTPQGVVAVCRFLDRPLAHVLDGLAEHAAGTPGESLPPVVAVCADVRDPGNAGTVIRCADAAGAAAAVFAGTSVDPYNPKAVRASVGSLFHLPVARTDDVLEPIETLRAAGLQVLAADGSGPDDLEELADAGVLGVATAWVFGNEAHGLDPAIAQACDRRVAIPIHGRAESLNLATAAALCLYASARALRRSSERR